MEHIAIIIDNICLKAGTERAVCNLSNGLVNRYSDLYDITIISLFSNKLQDTFFELDKRVKIIHLDHPNDFSKITKVFWYKDLIQKVRRVVSENQFDILIGTTYVQNILLPLITINKDIKTIGCEHEVYNYPPKLLQLIRRFAYLKLDSVVVLNEMEQKKFHFLKNTSVIPNSLPFETDKKSALTENKIIAVGRLTHQKGFDMLMDIYENICRQVPKWELNIFGDGEDFELLESKIKEKGLEEQIKLRGSVKNISEKYLESSIFVLSSRWESFGLVIIEAMNHGLPIVSFDCDGPKNLIDENKSGFLIPQFDKKTFSEKLLLLINNKEKRKEMGEVALTTSLKYKEENIIPLWNKQIQSILKNLQSN